LNRKIQADLPKGQVDLSQIISDCLDLMTLPRWAKVLSSFKDQNPSSFLSIVCDDTSILLTHEKHRGVRLL